MPTVQSLGMSGLPLDTLLTSLQNNENLALQAIKVRQTDAQAKLSAYGKLQASVLAFKTAADVVAKADSFGAIATKTGSDAISATATTGAIPGQYSIQVDQLATTQTLVYAGQADRTTAIGTGGTISITLNDGKPARTLDLTGGDTSLNGLMKAINADPDIGVNATVVNDGQGTPYRLLLTSRTTGTEAAITQIAVTGNDELNAFLGTQITNGADSSNGGVVVQQAQDAALSINGIVITSHSNTISDVIDGVSLTLNKTTGADAPASLNLSRDDSAAKKAITDFVSAYNTLQTTIKSLTAYDVTAQASQPLTGDSVARSVQTRLQNVLSGAFDSVSGTNLSAIGIATSTDAGSGGQLVIDQAKLDRALAENPSGIKALFSGSTGIGSSVSTAADTFTRSGGIFSTTTDGLNKTIADIQKQYDATSALISQRMETYRTQFTQLDSMVTQMNSLSSYLTQQLSALNATQKSK